MSLHLKEWECHMLSIGIDVSKDHLDRATSAMSNSIRFTNTLLGIQQLIDWVKEQRQEVERIVLEATGQSLQTGFVAC